MKKISRRSFLQVAAACGIATTATACAAASSTTTTSTSTAASSAASSEAAPEEPVELIWYTRFDDEADTAMVNEALNKLTLEKINATINFINLPYAAYNDKMQVILGGREECDIVFTGAGYADFWGNATRGAFLPLDDLMAEYAPDTYEAIPEAFWDGVRMNGEIYGVINYQIEAKEASFQYQKEIVDSIDFDFSSIKTMQDAEPFLAKVHEKYPEKVTVLVGYVDLLPLMGYDEIGTAGSPGAILIDGGDLSVVNQYESEKWLEYVKLQRSWFEKGYIATDAATTTSYAEMQKAGKIAGQIGNTKPGGLQSVQNTFGGIELVETKIMEGRVLPSALAATLLAVSSTSKNPEKAMQFINLLNTDKEVYNLVCWGIEDVHYTKVDDNRIELVADSGYCPNKAWANGNTFNSYLFGTQSDTVNEETKALNENASVSPLLGFVFDMEPVKNQAAQCQSVYDQYYRAIITGSVDPDKYVPEFLEKLEAAGAKEVIAEKQAQIDAWKATK